MIWTTDFKKAPTPTTEEGISQVLRVNSFSLDGIKIKIAYQLTHSLLYCAFEAFYKICNTSL